MSKYFMIYDEMDCYYDIYIFSIKSTYYYLVKSPYIFIYSLNTILPF